MWQWLYGLHAVESALRARRRKMSRLVLRKGALSAALENLRQQAKTSGVAVHFESPHSLETLCGSPVHQGAALQCTPPPTQGEAFVWPLARSRPPRAGVPLVLALDQVLDPRNLGAIVRSAAAFGAQAVVIPRRHSAPLSPAASKAAAGALEYFPIVETPNLARFIVQAAEAGFWSIAAVAAGGQPPQACPKDRPLLLILGGEGTGIRPLVLRRCDYRLTLPLPGQGHLNVSAAAAILLQAFIVG